MFIKTMLTHYNWNGLLDTIASNEAYYYYYGTFSGACINKQAERCKQAALEGRADECTQVHNMCDWRK